MILDEVKKANRKVWKKCDICKIQTRNIYRYKEKTICYNCYRKHITILGCPIYGDKLSRGRAVTVNLTARQSVGFDKRIKFLYPNRQRMTSEYIRELILTDLEMAQKNEEYVSFLKNLKDEDQN